MKKPDLHRINWEKVIDVLNGNLPAAIALNEAEVLLLQQLQAVKASVAKYRDVNLDVDAEAARLANRLGFEDSVLQPIKSRKPAVKLWPRIAIAAAVVAAMAFGIWLYNSRHPEGSEVTRALYANDIAPGKSTATLTLANGKTIILSDAKTGVIINADKLTYSDGTALAAHSPEGTQTITTPRGGTYQARLPDGSMVWINAASSLTYSAVLNERGQRRVKLSGEAYFEITKDKAHPFIVQTDKQEVEVLGTHFNIDSYADQPETKTTLLEGSVKVTGKGGVKIIKPGQQAILSQNSIKVADVEAEDAIAWKNGYFMFDIETLESVMQKISRWYDVKVVYEDPALKSKTFLGTISRFENISKVLNMLERTDEARFRIKDRTVYISKK